MSFRTRTLSSFAQDQRAALPTFLFAYWFCVSTKLPVVRVFTKNQRRSRLIGPPIEKLASQFFKVAGASAKPRARSSSSMLLAWPNLPAQLPKTFPLKLLPPVFGMMLKDGAPRSTSPRPPEIETWTSLALFMSYA